MSDALTEQRIEKIWKKNEDEVVYWLREHLGPMESKDVSIHEIDLKGGEYCSLVFDINDCAVVVIRTDTNAMDVNESSQYMMLYPDVVEKIAKLYNLHKKPCNYP